MSGKIHVTHNFVDYDEEKDKKVCKFVCTTYWAGQFEAIRAEYLGDDENASYIRSLALSQNWATQGGKSKAKFAKTADDRFVVKMISNVELQMFLEFAPGYFGECIIHFLYSICLTSLHLKRVSFILIHLY